MRTDTLGEVPTWCLGWISASFRTGGLVEPEQRHWLGNGRLARFRQRWRCLGKYPKGAKFHCAKCHDQNKVRKAPTKPHLDDGSAWFWCRKEAVLSAEKVTLHRFGGEPSLGGDGEPKPQRCGGGSGT
jgi:hypothetical protein